MTHERKPGTIKQSISEVVDALGGSNQVAKLLDMGSSTIDAWKNPGRASFPSIDQLVQLESIFAQKTGSISPTPIIMSMIHAVEKNIAPDGAIYILDELLKSRTIIEELTTSLIQRARNENLGKSANLNREETIRLTSACFDAIRMLTRLSIHLSKPTEVKSARKFSIMPRID